MTMSKVEECRGDTHEPIKRLSQVQVQPPKNPTKPLTSFNIADILGVTPSSGKEQNDRNCEKLQHVSGKVNRSTSPEHPENTQQFKELSKHHLANSIDHNHHLSDEDIHANNKRRINDHLSFFSHFNKTSRNDKTVEDFRAAAAAAAAVNSINQNNFFSPPFGCIPKTLLHGFIPPFNLNHNHHLPQRHIISQGEHEQLSPSLILQQQQQQHHHHHQQQQQHHHQQLRGPVNLCTGNTNTNTNTNNNTNNNNNSKIVRPWDRGAYHEASPSPVSKTPPASLPSSASTTTTTTVTSEDSFDEEDEEISVDDEAPPTPPGKKAKGNGDSVSPLDALMAMTSKTFAGLDNTSGADPKRKDQAVLFGKQQPPKKRRKSRTAFTNQQIYELEKRFLYQKYLTPADRDEIAINLGLSNAQVITWFQNRRAKLKRDLEELKSDVTASKKLPLSRNMTGSVAEIELRRIQERTLRESFTNGGLQSPSSCSIASLSDDHDVGTPVHSPEKIESDRIHVDVVTSSEPMDTDFSSENSCGKDAPITHRNSLDDNDKNDNENSNVSLSPRHSNHASDCNGGRCEIDNQKMMNNFSVEISPGLV